MIKILFLIRDLGQGGAEKVLVNLVNNMDPQKFDISVTALFGGGVNEQFLAPHIRFRSIWKHSFPGNSHLMKLLTPAQLHKLCVKEKYDIEVAYLEGPTARVISGCSHRDTVLISWIHTEFPDRKALSAPFRSEKEALSCYKVFHQTVCVSRRVSERFQALTQITQNVSVLYNTVESDKILALSQEELPSLSAVSCPKLIAVGTLKEVKGFDRLLRIIKRLVDEDYPLHLTLLGIGPLWDNLQQSITDLKLSQVVSMPGYDTNPYKYIRNSDLFVCSSHTEGFSTVATEALIVGTPVCTVEVSGMKEMLGEHNEYGIITGNTEDALYEGIRSLLDDPALLDHYARQASIRGKAFQTKETVSAVEAMFTSLASGDAYEPQEKN